MMSNHNSEQICLMNELRMLWSQHVFWTRSFIISTAEDLDDLAPVTERLLENPKDFAKCFATIFGTNTANKFRVLLTEHLKIGGDFVTACKNKEAQKAADYRTAWYKNADDIAKFLSCINKHWSEEKWQNMMYSHLKMTEKMALLRLHGKYEEDIKIFDKIECEAMEMADYMFCGITKLCGKKT